MTGQFFVADDKHGVPSIWHRRSDVDRYPMEMLNRDLVPSGEAADEFWACVVHAVSAPVVGPGDVAVIVEAADLTQRHVRQLVEFDWTPPWAAEEHRAGILLGVFAGLTFVCLDLGDDDGMVTLPSDTKITVGVSHA